MEETSRCEWANASPEYIAYHDNEWGTPVIDDQKQFEFLVLEGAQAGLSWATILKRRESYRKAFAQFNPAIVAQFDGQDMDRLLSDAGIIRNRLKIVSAINNARRFLEVQQEFGSFTRYIWQFVDGKPIVNHWRTTKEIPATSDESDKLSKDLKKRGFTFVGSVIMYAHMQACGLVNDHTVDCFRRNQAMKGFTS